MKKSEKVYEITREFIETTINQRTWTISESDLLERLKSKEPNPKLIRECLEDMTWEEEYDKYITKTEEPYMKERDSRYTCIYEIEEDKRTTIHQSWN